MEDRISLEELEELKERARLNKLAKVDSEKKESCDRVTATFSMVHEACGFDPIRAHVIFTELLKTHDQPYQRRMLVKNEPTVLNCSDWVKEPGYLIIENKKGGTEALIYVCIGDYPTPFFQIAPGHLFVVPLAPKSLSAISLRSDEDCPANITIMPS